MKTFQQFCEDAYQLNEFDVRGALRSVSRSPLVNNPVTKTITKVVQNPLVKKASSISGGALNIGFNRALGAEKLTTDDPNIGPIERGLGGISAMSMFAPGVSQATGIAHNIIGSSPQLQKIDKRIGIEHGKALKANPQGYLQMLGRSF